jgi:hypothetical protein
LPLLRETALRSESFSEIGCSALDCLSGSTRVVFENFDAADDQVVWEFAKNAGYIIVSKAPIFVSFRFYTGIRQKPSGFVSATLRQKLQRTY